MMRVKIIEAMLIGALLPSMGLGSDINDLLINKLLASWCVYSRDSVKAEVDTTDFTEIYCLFYSLFFKNELPELFAYGTKYRETKYIMLPSIVEKTYSGSNYKYSDIQRYILRNSGFIKHSVTSRLDSIELDESEWAKIQSLELNKNQYFINPRSCVEVGIGHSVLIPNDHYYEMLNKMLVNLKGNAVWDSYLYTLSDRLVVFPTSREGEYDMFMYPKIKAIEIDSGRTKAQVIYVVIDGYGIVEICKFNGIWTKC